MTSPNGGPRSGSLLRMEGLEACRPFCRWVATLVLLLLLMDFLAPWAWGAAEVGESIGARPDPYSALHAIELPLIRALQRVGDFGDLMTWISDLGPGRPMLIIIAILLCAVDTRLAARMAVVVVVGLWLRELLALTLQSPRPYWLGEGIRTFRNPPLSTPTFGLPSGHAMGSAAFWFFLAWESGRRWAWWIAGGLTAAVCLSRVYLGLHFISDVVLGVTLGLCWIAALRRWESDVKAWWWRSDKSARLMAAVTAGLALVVISAGVRMAVLALTSDDAWARLGETARSASGSAWSGGALCGLALAWISPVPWTGAGDPWRLRLARLIAGGVPGAIYFFRPAGWRLSALLPEGADWLVWFTRFGGGVFLAWAAWYLLPRFFLKFGLAKPSEDGPGATGVSTRSRDSH